MAGEKVSFQCLPPQKRYPGRDHIEGSPDRICDAIEADVPVYLKGIQSAEDALQAKIERNTTWVDMTAWWQSFQFFFEVEDASFFVNEKNMVEVWVIHFSKSQVEDAVKRPNSQVVISPREAPSQDLQNPAVARQVLWCVFFFHFFCPSEDEEQEENKLWMEKDEDEKGEQDEKGEDWRWKQTMTTFFSLLFPSFSIHFCPSLHRSTGRGCGCSRHRGVQPWWPCLWQCHWSGSLISLDRGLSGGWVDPV